MRKITIFLLAIVINGISLSVSSNNGAGTTGTGTATGTADTSRPKILEKTGEDVVMVSFELSKCLVNKLTLTSDAKAQRIKEIMNREQQKLQQYKNSCTAKDRIFFLKVINCQLQACNNMPDSIAEQQMLDTLTSACPQGRGQKLDPEANLTQKCLNDLFD